MVAFPNCKINLGLHIVSKRQDGFHDLETVFYPVPWRDALEIITSPTPGQDTPKLTVSGIPIDALPENNICVKAWALLKQDFPQLPVVDIHLHKAIPAGAGLGGGSSDGASMLILLNEKYRLGLTDDQLIPYALKLGSDCPVFILNRPCYATGRGEVLTPVELDLSAWSLLIINPGIHINTGWAFSRIQPRVPVYSLKQSIQQPLEKWRQLIYNDFEEAIFKTYPQVGLLKTNLYEKGAIYASLSGSGSSVFAILPKNMRPSLQVPGEYSMHFIP